ncbi:MAG: YsnF/AvaK domain-containing protein [Thermoproteota archaeon]|nr:YsnF/AvaK domain-containing protein [Thermoproteota archaeon]
MSSSKSIDWFELGLSRKEARGLNNYDLGEVQEVGQTYVVTQKGTIKKEKFYIPKYLAEGYDGDELRFKVSEEDAINNFARDSPPSADEYYKYKTPDVPTDIETRIPVMAERLEVSKTESVMEATIIKEPVTETKTVEVPLIHEELIIERRPADEFKTTDQAIESKTEITIQLKNEELEVTKQPYVKEELVLKKKPVTETRTVTEQIRSEQVKVKGPDGKDLEES